MTLASKRFTLVELLVVIAIISVLASLLLPVLQTARESALQATCLNLVKQQLLGMQLYLNDYNDIWFPAPNNMLAGGSHRVVGNVSGTLKYVGLGGALPYLDNTAEVLICPETNLLDNRSSTATGLGLIKNKAAGAISTYAFNLTSLTLTQNASARANANDAAFLANIPNHIRSIKGNPAVISDVAGAKTGLGYFTRTHDLRFFSLGYLDGHTKGYSESEVDMDMIRFGGASSLGIINTARGNTGSFHNANWQPITGYSHQQIFWHGVSGFKAFAY